MKTIFLLCVTPLLVEFACGQGNSAAVVVRPPASVPATVGQTVRVTCVGYGNPAVAFTWWKSNGDTLEQLDTSNSAISILTNSIVVSGITYYASVLQICNLKLSDAAQYSCNASNSASGGLTATSYAVFTLSVSPDTTVAASIVVQPPETSKVDVDTIVELVCVAYGNPIPTISWSRIGSSKINNDSLPNALVYSDTVSYGDIMFRRSVLQFCTITSRDTNIYACSATNGIVDQGVPIPVTTFTLTVNVNQATTSTSTTPSRSTPRPTATPTEMFVTVSETGYQVAVAILVILVVALIVVLVVVWVFIFIKKGIPFKNLINEEQAPPAINESADDDFTKMKFSDLEAREGYEHP